MLCVHRKGKISRLCEAFFFIKLEFVHFSILTVGKTGKWNIQHSSDELNIGEKKNEPWKRFKRECGTCERVAVELIDELFIRGLYMQNWVRRKKTWQDFSGWNECMKQRLKKCIKGFLCDKLGISISSLLLFYRNNHREHKLDGL